MIQRIGFETGHVVSLDRARQMACTLSEAGWTIGELREAERLIKTDALLTKEIGYSRTVGVGVFALARERLEVRRGRLFSYGEARRLAEEHQQPIGDMFTVVRMHDDKENAPLKAWWRLT